MRTIRVMFLEAVPNDPFVNRIVSRIDPPYCHVELEFDDNTQGPCLASSIFAGETVFFKRRTFSNPNYTTITLHVEDSSYARIVKFCEQKAKGNVQFDSWGMYSSWLAACIPGPLRRCLAPVCFQTNRTFCSRFVTEALQAGDIPEVRGVDACLMRPSLLHKRLSTSTRKCFSTVPYKMLLMTQRVQLP